MLENIPIPHWGRTSNAICKKELSVILMGIGIGIGIAIAIAAATVAVSEIHTSMCICYFSTA